MSHISSLMVNKSHGSSVSTSLSESPMTLGSLPTSEISPVTDSSPLEDAELEEHFVVKFQLQVQHLQKSHVAIFLGSDAPFFPIT